MAHNIQKSKSGRQSEKERREIINWSKSYWLQAPLIAIVAIIPLLVYYHVFDTKLSHYAWFGGSDAQVDFYVYSKMCVFVCVCVYMLLVLLFQHFFGEHRLVWSKQFIPLIVYAGLTILSTIFSISKYHSLHGSYQHFESVWVLLGYCLTAYYTFYLVRTEQALERLLNWVGIGAALMAVVGLSQVFGHDILQSKLIKTIITPTGYDISKLSWNIAAGRAYLTLENPNYVGSYAALLIPLLIGMAFAASQIWKRIVCAVLAVVMLVILFSSQSRTGIVALAAAFLVMLLFARGSVVKHWKISIAIVVLAVGVFVGYNNIYMHNYLLERFKSIAHIEKTEYPLQYIETNEDNVVVGYNGNELVIRVEEDKKGQDVIKLSDGDGKEIECPVPKEDGWSYLVDERFPLPIRLWSDEGYEGFCMMIDNVYWVFVNQTKGELSGYFCYLSGNLRKLSKENTYNGFFAEHQRFGSGRGFIWSRTFPLIKKYFFLGSGPDTYVQVFPHDELVGRANAGYRDMLITKPHSFFLQIAEQTGVPSVLALLLFIGIYVIDTVRIYWRDREVGSHYWIALAILGAVIGFLVSGLTNDSLLGITPIFYLIVGMGIRINHLEKMQ